MKRQKLFFSIGLFALFALTISLIPASAEKSHGTPSTEINSNKVCGDMLCSEVNAISEADVSDQDNQFDDTMVFQQSLPSTMRSTATASFAVSQNTLDAKSVFANAVILKSKNFFTIQGNDSVVELVKSKTSASSIKFQKEFKAVELKKPVTFKSIAPKMLNGMEKMQLKLDNLPAMQIDKKIRGDSNILKEKLERLSMKPAQIQKPSFDDSKFEKMLEDLKDKKLEIEKSK